MVNETNKNLNKLNEEYEKYKWNYFITVRYNTSKTYEYIDEILKKFLLIRNDDTKSIIRYMLCGIENTTNGCKHIHMSIYTGLETIYDTNEELMSIDRYKNSYYSNIIYFREFWNKEFVGDIVTRKINDYTIDKRREFVHDIYKYNIGGIKYICKEGNYNLYSNSRKLKQIK